MPKPREPDLFSWASANQDKVLPPDSPVFSEKTAVPERQRSVADEISIVIAPQTPSPIRKPGARVIVESPLANESDGVVQFLERLAEEYDDETQTLDAGLARAIEVHEDYLVIGGHKLSRKNEIVGEGDEELMKFDAAQRWFDELPTEEEWTEIIDGIPGNGDLEKIENMLNILFGPYHDFVRDENKEVYPLVHFWVQKKSVVTSTKKKDKRGKPISHRLTIGQASKWDRESHRFIVTGGNKDFLCFTRRILG